MNDFHLFDDQPPSPDALPGFIKVAEDIQGVRVARLQGNVGHEIGDAVAARTAQVAEHEMLNRPLLLDFADVTGTDTSTIAFLVKALRMRMPSGARVGIIHPTPKLIAELEIARLDPMFRIFATEKDAIAELRSQGGNPAH